MRFWVSMLVVGLAIFCAVGTVEKGFAVEYQDANAQILVADQSLRAAFNSTLDAEQSGANVTALLVRLNDAGSNLTSAEEALADGDYAGAVSLAGTCKALADGVGVDAVVLKADAIAAASYWLLTVWLCVVGSVVFVVVLWFVWRRFRAGYLKRMLSSRPEVNG